MQQYRIERISRENLYQLQVLYRSVYSKNVPLESLTCKYNTHMFGVEWLGYLALTIDNEPAAFYGVIPCHFRIGPEIFLAAQSADTMTHPQHRNRGLFIQLATKTYDLARSEGVDFIFGFPNKNSYGGFVKLKWVFMETPLQVFVLKGSKLPLAIILSKIPILKKFVYTRVKKNFDGISEEANLSDPDGVTRDRIFFQYKNQYSKTFVEKKKGIFAWLKEDGLLKVGLIRFDAFISPEAGLHFLVETAKKMGCHAIIFMTSYNTGIYNALIKLVSPINGLPIGFYNLTDRQIDFQKATFEYCDIDIF